MKEITNQELKQLQSTELDILNEFDRICKKHNIDYILTAGTLLGAIRHNGFIPWDDDIDVAMSRENYNKFIKIQKKELNNEKYYFQSMETDKEFGLPFGKLRRKNTLYLETTSPLSKEKQGIWIDIFPIDKISENKLIAFITFVRVFYYKTIIAFKLNFKYASTGIKKLIFNIIKFLSKFYSIESAKKHYYRIIEKENKKETKMCINHGGAYLLKEIVPINYYNNITNHKFENKDYYIPIKYDEFLTSIYGDYMTPPPIEKRKAHHLVEELKLPDKKTK